MKNPKPKSEFDRVVAAGPSVSRFMLVILGLGALLFILVGLIACAIGIYQWTDGYGPTQFAIAFLVLVQGAFMWVVADIAWSVRSNTVMLQGLCKNMQSTSD